MFCIVSKMTMLKLFLKLTMILIVTIAAQPLPGCPDKCGNVTVPYPFGLIKGCYLSKYYHVNCTKLQIYNTTFKLSSITLDGYMRGSLQMGHHCYGKLVDNKTRRWSEPRIKLSRFPVSSTRNLLTTVGCDARADMKVIKGEDYITGCLSMSGCNMLRNGSCSGMGCSQVPVPYNKVNTFRIHTQRNTNTSVGYWGFNNCTYGFVVEKDEYTFSTTDFDNMENRSFPVIFEWSVGNASCEQAQNNNNYYVCGKNSVCSDTTTTTTSTEFDQTHPMGYRCLCAPGYQGNPYLPDGCQDIDECKEKNDCIHVHGCSNINGGYSCSCLWGQKGDGRKHGEGCFYSGGSLFAGVSMGSAACVVVTLILYGGLKQRQITKSREKLFKKNGGLILQKLLFECKQSSPVKIYAAGALEKATNNFHKTNVIGQGGYGTVYKGTLPDKTTVAIKKSKSIDHNQIEQFINEVIMLSEISHPNIVKLLGCCLETQTPLLVYEFINNKTLYQHLHEQPNFISFEKRLHIATQTAQALAYMHSTTQIIHRDIKTSNILLTDDYTAKLSDFGISRFIPVDQTHLQTLVHGTLGYIDPEYFRSGILTEKSDVYSFGMLLIELLTGKKVFSYDGTESDIGLATYFVTSLEMGCLITIVDDKLKKDGVDEHHIKKIAKLAKDCVELAGKNRPNMKQVTHELQELTHAYLKASIIFNKLVNYFDPEPIILFD